MIELKIDPRKDAVMAPAMRRFAGRVQGALSAYEKERPLKKHTDSLASKLEGILTEGLFVAAERGYDLATKAINLHRSPSEISSLKQSAKRRAVLAAKLIAKTSKKAMEGSAIELNAAITKKNVASKDRAAGIAEFEMPRMMFIGMRKGWSRVTGTRMPRHRWFPTSDNVCELCQENEDEGSIPIDEPFPSGDYESPIHIGCECIVAFYI